MWVTFYYKCHCLCCWHKVNDKDIEHYFPLHLLLKWIRFFFKSSQTQSVVCCTNTNSHFYPESNQPDVTPADRRLSCHLRSVSTSQHDSFWNAHTGAAGSPARPGVKIKCLLHLSPASSQCLFSSFILCRSYSQIWSGVLINHLNKT